MMKTMAVISALLFSFTASASEVTVIQALQPALQNMVARAGDFKVGDTNNYNMDMGFIKGTMVMSVKSVDADGVWLTQDLSLGIAGNQKAETLIDPATGEVKKMLVNGKEQTVEKPDFELVQIVDDNITVPAGTFDCFHVTLKDKKSGDETNVWQNATIPISGMIKTISPTQLGEATIELTSFQKAN